jgi:hypothetical protein
VNYLKGTLQGLAAGSIKPKNTWGTLDLGGSSMQAAFSPAKAKLATDPPKQIKQLPGKRAPKGLREGNWRDWAEVTAGQLGEIQHGIRGEGRQGQ